MLSYKTYEVLLKRIMELLKIHFGEDLLSCAVFGSVARGTAEKQSDIDVIIVHKGDRIRAGENFGRVNRQLREDAEYKRLEKEGFTPDPFPVLLSEEELAQNPWVLLDVTEEGIILFDKEDIFKKRLDHIKQRLKELGSKRIFLPDATWYWDLKPDWKPGEVIKL